LVHVPSAPVCAHDVHEPAQAVSQQTPCAQNAERHSLGSEQDAPRIFWPHELELQVLGAMQFWSVVHALKQVLPLQTNGAHGSESGGVHWPVALHVETGV
jgi:hypothetical protein